MSTEIRERYAEAAARWALMYPIPSWGLRQGAAAEKLAKTWGEQIARHLTEDVRDEEMAQLRAERDAVMAGLEQTAAALAEARVAIEQVREEHTVAGPVCPLCDELTPDMETRTDPDCTHFARYCRVCKRGGWPCSTLRALDASQRPEGRPTSH